MNSDPDGLSPELDLRTRLADRSSDGHWLQPSVSQPFVMYSHHIREMLGWSFGPDSPTHADLTAVVHPDDRPAFEHFFSDPRTPRVVENRLRHANGEYFWVRITAIVLRLADSADAWATGTISAIQAPCPLPGVLTPEDLLSREQIEKVHSPAFILSPNALLLHANAAGLKQLGETMDVLFGRPLTASLTPDFAKQLLHAIDTAMISHQDGTFEGNCRGRRWLAHVVPQLPGPGELPDRIYLVCHDLTAVYEHAENKLAAQQELSRTLVKEVHHRIKNNLQGVVGLLRLHIQDVDHSMETMQLAISQLVSIAAVYGIQARLDEDRIYLCSIVNEVAHSVRATYPRVLIAGPSSERIAALHESYAVPVALIVNELVMNSAKHTESTPDGTVSLGIRVADAAVELIVTNRPAFLPAGFDIVSGQELGSGLRLAQSLLPTEHASLSIQQLGDSVEATLRLHSPAIVDFERQPPPPPATRTSEL